MDAQYRDRHNHLSARLGDLERRHDALEKKVDKHGDRLDDMSGKMDTMNGNFAKLFDMMENGGVPRKTPRTEGAGSGAAGAAAAPGR